MMNLFSFLMSCLLGGDVSKWEAKSQALPLFSGPEIPHASAIFYLISLNVSSTFTFITLGLS